MMPSDEELLKRAVTSARQTSRKHGKLPRWCAIMDRFALGSTYSKNLCWRFDLDPEELIE